MLWRWCSENKVAFIYASSAATYGGGENGYDDNENLLSNYTFRGTLASISNVKHTF